VRTPDGPRQKTVCSLGNLDPRPRKEWIKLARRVEEVLSGQGDLLNKPCSRVQEIVEKVKAYRAKREKENRQETNRGADQEEAVVIKVNEVQTIDHCEAGPMHVGYQFWKRLGLDGILERAGLSGYAREITCAMTMNRLIFPSSEHAMPDWIRRTAMGDILRTDFSDINDDTLYRNLDKLYPNRSRIETDLVNAERNLFNLNASIFFYDLTSTYFEGQALGNPKAKRGYSRDKRPDCKQVVIGLVIGREGFPLAHEVFEGNLQDRKSLGGMLDILGKRVGIKAGQTVVIDRGMAFKENLDEIRSRGLHYIVASRQIERNEWLNEFETCADFDDVIRIPSPWNPFQTKTRVRVKKMKKNGAAETYVLCLSDERANKDRAIRENQEKRFKEDLYKLEKRVADGRLKEPVKIGECVGRIKERYPRVARYYDVEYNKDGAKGVRP
jgi:hypothetical protein